MSNLQENFNNIIKDLEKNIENKKDLEYIKTQVYNISLLFIDELDKISELNMNRVDKLISRHKELTNKMQIIESKMRKLEEDIYLDSEDDELGFEIVCPYCCTEFELDLSGELREEVTCPECCNVIELDWNHEGCGGDCCSCEEECDCEDDEENHKCKCGDNCECGDDCNCGDDCDCDCDEDYDCGCHSNKDDEDM